ncbi:MAG: hypothetical protein U5R30_07040 [Deltaproteobacteria bacterium]|nr:hypothetical protein [Deltaproteobacteria bacterium]
MNATMKRCPFCASMNRSTSEWLWDDTVANGRLTAAVGSADEGQPCPVHAHIVGHNLCFGIRQDRILQAGGFERVMVCVGDLRQYGGVRQLPGKGVAGQEFIDHADGIDRPVERIIGNTFLPARVR